MILNELINKVLMETDCFANPYFVNLRGKLLTKKTLSKHRFSFCMLLLFSRPMAALAAKSRLPELRLEILRNVWKSMEVCFHKHMELS